MWCFVSLYIFSWLAVISLLNMLRCCSEYVLGSLLWILYELVNCLKDRLGIHFYSACRKLYILASYLIRTEINWTLRWSDFNAEIPVRSCNIAHQIAGLIFMYAEVIHCKRESLNSPNAVFDSAITNRTSNWKPVHLPGLQHYQRRHTSFAKLHIEMQNKFKMITSIYRDYSGAEQGQCTCNR
jgi:hypothetical protein